MGRSATTKSYASLIQLLKSRGFINISSVQRSNQKFYLAEYGAPGTLMRHNIFKQWWECMVSQQSQVFPVESPALQLSSHLNSTESQAPDEEVSFREHLQRDCISKYLEVLKLTNGKLPLSIASVGPCVSYRHVEEGEPEAKKLLFGGSNYTRLLLQNYTSPIGTNIVLDYWLQLRLSWWKKFSRNPANFSVISNSNNNNNNNNKHNQKNDASSSDSTTSGTNNKNDSPLQNSMSITYQFPWGAETVEEIKNVGDKYLASQQQNGDKKYMGTTSGKKSYLPYCIECETSVEVAAAVWLVDSFHQSQIQTTSKTKTKSKPNLILQLHPQIAPYQVALVVASSSSTSSSSSSTPTELIHLCNHLEKDLQSSGISVFNTARHGSTVEAHFNRNDQLGIPYTVILGEATVSDGSINTRHRDTNIRVPSHISTIVEDLQQNLTAQLD